MLPLSLTASPHPWWQPHPSNKWHICFQDELCCFLTAIQKNQFFSAQKLQLWQCFFSGIITTPLLMLSAISLNLVFQRTSLRTGDPTAALILAKFKPVSHSVKGQGSRLHIKKYFNLFYWFEAPGECSLRQSGLYLALLLFLFLQV